MYSLHLRLKVGPARYLLPNANGCGESLRGEWNGTAIMFSPKDQSSLLQFIALPYGIQICTSALVSSSSFLSEL